MKHTSSAGRYRRTELTKLKALKTTMGATISTLGLIGTMAIYKKIESQLDPSETEQIAIIQSLISNVKSKINDQKPKNFSNNNAPPL